MTVETSIDFEFEIKRAFDDRIISYLRPLPEEFLLPSILISKVGGTQNDRIDYADIVLDARAKSEAEAVDLMRKALGLLDKAVSNQTTRLRYLSINSSGSWGQDPIRPDLSMYSARIRVNAHQTTMEV